MLRNILRTLQSIEGLLMDILLELKKLNAKPAAPEVSGPSADKWLEEGIGNILGFQAGKKRSDNE